MQTARTLAAHVPSLLLPLLLWGTASAAPAPAAPAIETGSLLVYPCFDNRVGSTTVVTVVNTAGEGSIAVEFVYIDGDSCLEFNRTVVLTPKDSFSAVTRVHFPDLSQGYVYAFAKDPGSGAAVAWDHLAGTLHRFSGLSQLGFKTQPFVFRSGSGVDGLPTDVDSDGVRDLNGVEYEAAPDVIVVPHFFGNRNVFGLNVHGDLALIGLTGIQFRTIVDFAIYNDNEEPFSSQVEFDCWDLVSLTSIANSFRHDFLRASNDDPTETQGLADETGWYEIDGRTAFSTADAVDDPAFLALQIETTGLLRHTAAALPFSRGTQTNGDLLPLGIFADRDDTSVETVLYGGGFFSTFLYEVDKGDGSLAPIGLSTVAIEGLAMDVTTDTLYASEIAGDDNLYVLDPADGSATILGPMGFGQVRGLAFDPNTDTLYGADSASDSLITLDTTTGAGTLVGPLGFNGARGLAFDAATGTLYGHGTATDQLYRIDPTTGAGTAIGPIGIRSPRGLAFDPATGKLFATGDDLTVYEVDPATGASTPVGTAADDRIGGLAVGLE